MSTYRIYFTTTMSTSVSVEADDLEAAVDIAYEELPGSLCHQCASTRDVGDWDADDSYYEVDGEPVEVKP